jgi:hypothetical protein
LIEREIKNNIKDLKMWEDVIRKIKRVLEDSLQEQYSSEQLQKELRQYIGKPVSMRDINEIYGLGLHQGEVLLAGAIKGIIGEEEKRINAFVEKIETLKEWNKDGE